MPIRTEALVQQLRRLVTPATLGAETDSALLDRFAHHHDDLAFTALVQRHGALVLGVCRRLLGNHQDAEDATQATFLVLARKAPFLKVSGSLAAFLHGVARNLALKCLRANSRRRQREMLSAPATGLAPDPLDELTARELLVVLDEEVAQLPEAYRLPLILCCLEGRTQEEAARQLGWTVGSVKGRLERGRARLHTRLVRRGLTLPAALLALQVSRGAVMAGTSILGQATIHAILTAGGEGLSAQAMALADGVLRSLAVFRWKVGLGLLLLAGVLAAGAGGLARPTPVPRAPEAGRTPTTEPPRLAHADVHGDPLPPGALARMGTVRFRQGGMLAFLPDGKTLLSGGFGSWNTVHFWQVPSGKGLRHPLKVENGLVNSIALSPDGKVLAVGQYENSRYEVSLLNVATGKELRRVGGFHSSPDTVTFSSDSRLLAVDDLNEAALYETATGKHLRDIVTPGLLRALAFAPDGKVLAAAGIQGNLGLWDVATGKNVRALEHPDEVHAVVFSPDGKMLASGREGTLCLFDVATGQELRRLGPAPRTMTSVAFSPDGLTLATGSDAEWPEQEGKRRSVGVLDYSRTLCLWDITTGRQIRCLKGPREDIRSVAFSPDGHTLAAGASDGQIHLWEILTGQERGRLAGHQNTVSTLAFAPDGRRLVSGSYDTTLFVWNTAAATGDRQEPLTARQLDRLWDELAATNAHTGYRAVQALAQHAPQTVTFLEERLRGEGQPIGPRIATLVADLDSNDFAVREQATRQLEQLGEEATGALRRALQGKPSPEVRRRITHLLQRGAGAAPSPASVRIVRAVEVLEIVGSFAARDALRRLAAREPKGRMAEEARAALARLTRRAVGSP